MEHEPLSQRLPPWLLAFLAFLACVIAGVILIAIDITFFGVMTLGLSILVGFVVWLGADRI